MRAHAALFCLLLCGCGSSADDPVVREKALGAAEHYSVMPDEAWQIARSVLASAGATRIEERRGENLLLGRAENGSAIAVWVEPGGCGSTLTVRASPGAERALHRGMTEAVFAP